MKKTLLFTLAVAALTFSGCATLSGSSVRVTEVASINHAQSAKVQSYGAANATILGPIFAKTDDKCSLADIARSAKKKFANVSDVINIRMEEESEEKGGKKVYSCKISALAVNYKNISPEEARIWRNLLNEEEATTETIDAPVASFEPAIAGEETTEEATETEEQ